MRIEAGGVVDKRLLLLDQLIESLEGVFEARGEEGIIFGSVIFRLLFGVFNIIAVTLGGSGSVFDSRGSGGCEEDVVAPGPADELAKLLEDEEVEDSAGSDFVIVITRDTVPVKPRNRHRQRQHQRNWQRI